VVILIVGAAPGGGIPTGGAPKTHKFKIPSKSEKCDLKGVACQGACLAEPLEVDGSLVVLAFEV